MKKAELLVKAHKTSNLFKKIYRRLFCIPKIKVGDKLTYPFADYVTRIWFDWEDGIWRLQGNMIKSGVVYELKTFSIAYCIEKALIEDILNNKDIPNLDGKYIAI